MKRLFNNISIKMNLKNDMVFDVEFISSKGLMSLVKKTIQRKIDDRLVPYYDEKNSKCL